MLNSFNDYEAGIRGILIVFMVLFNTFIDLNRFL